MSSLGPKGAGKTAVFIHLLSKPSKIFAHDDMVVGMSLQNYKWQAHYLLGDYQKMGGFQHKDSWRFALYVEAVRAAYKKLTEDNEVVPKELLAAAKTLEKLFDHPVPNWAEVLGEKLFGLSSFKLPALEVGEELSVCGGEVSFDELRASSSLKARLNQNIMNLTDWLENSLKTLPESTKIFLVFYRLDEAWVDGFISESKSIVTGLLHAAEHVLHAFGGRIRPLIFLREDIFSTLDINDRNKLRLDCSESLRWTQDEIERLVLERINFYARKAGASQVNSLQDVFQEKDMRSRTTPVKHIFNRTMCRPRDMVAFLGLTFKVARDEGFHGAGGDKISTKAIYGAASL
ncbi:P-loop ATPase, Sll1717 family [Azotobacter chroococcum]